MDFTPIIIQVLSTLWYLIPLAILAIVLKSPWFKGVMGELIANPLHQNCKHAKALEPLLGLEEN
ncbi:hypothetical protein [Marinobacterium sp. BA1]|uniref:hypothetical protein n=1 Tax=Marinobacterium sp. BA1 TaxID=3138931 RepID=UPI0032E7D30C